VLTAVGLLEYLGGRVEPLGDVPAQGAELGEQPLGEHLLQALFHRLEHALEPARVHETEAAATGADREVGTERMDVEQEAVPPKRFVDVAQDVHDVLGLYSSE
jgi:hypothetical protein